MAERRVATTRRWLSGLLAGAALIAVASVLVALVEPHVPDLVGLPSIYLLAVLPVAIRWGAGPGIAVAAAGVTTFDFLFVAPRMSLTMGDARYGISLGVFLIAAVVIAQLAARWQRGVRESARLSREQAALGRVATLVARGVPAEEIFAAVADEIGRVLEADTALMLRLDEDGVTTVLGEMGYGPDEMPVGSRWELDPQLALAVAMRTGRSARRDDYRGVPGTLADIVRRMEIRSVVAIPITVEGRIWGALGVGTTRERFPADTEGRMAGFTDLVGTAIANAESRVEIARLLDVQASLRRVATLVAREVPPEEIIPTVAEEIGHVLDADALLIVRLDPDGVCTIVAQRGPHPPEPHAGQRWALDPGLAMTEAMRTGQPAYRDGYAGLGEPSAGYIESMGIRCSVAIPITVDGRVWGSLGISRIRAEAFPADTAERMAGFTELLATAVRNTRARAEIVRLLDEQAALRQVATVVAHGAPAREVFASVADEAIRLLGVDVAMLFRIPGETATFAAVSGWEGGPIGEAVRTNPELVKLLHESGTFRLDDIAETPEAVDALRGSGVRAVVGYSITVEGGLWGGFVVGSRGGPLPIGTEQRLASYAELIATAIANTENRAQILRLLEGQAALRRVATLVATGPSPTEVCRAVAEEVRGLLDLDDAGVCRYEPDGTAVLLVGLGENLSQWPSGTRWELDEVASSSEVWRTGRAARFDAEQWAYASGPVAAQLRDRGVRSVAATPVVVDGRLWGAVMAWSSRDSLPGDTEERLANFTELIAMAIGNAENRAETLRLLEEQAGLRRVAMLVATGPSPLEVSKVVADEVRRLLGVEDAGVCRYEPDGTGVLVVGLGPSISQSAQRWSLDNAAASSEVWRTGRSVRFDAERWADASSPIAAQLRRLEVHSVAASPIVVDGRLWGAVVVWSKAEPLPPDTEERMASFTELVAMAIGNAESRAELAASRARIVAASDEARRRIERDLHDGAQQRLVSLGLELRLAQASVPDELPEVRAGIGRVADELTNVLDELREMARGIHPAMLSEGGLRPALRTLARRAPLPVELDIATDARFPEPVEVAAYYVVSEALTNAVKHAEASYVHVTLTEVDGVMHLSVRDDGVGGADPQAGSGLIGLRDRVDALGGTVAVKSPPGIGTTVLVTLPVSGSRGT